MTRRLHLFAALPMAALLAVSSTAASADDPRGSSPATGWTGFYLGVGAGLSAMNTKLGAEPGPGVTDPGALGASGSADGLGANGALVSFMAGGDYQISERFVVGASLDVSLHDLATDVSVSIPGIDVSANGSVEVDHSWSIAGRVGYLTTVDTLVYVAGGYTRLGITEASVTVSGPFPTIQERATAPELHGLFLGAGFETRLSRHLSLRGEYRFTDFGEGKLDLPAIDSLDLNDLAQVEASPTLQIGQVSLAYRF